MTRAALLVLMGLGVAEAPSPSYAQRVTQTQSPKRPRKGGPKAQQPEAKPAEAKPSDEEEPLYEPDEQVSSESGMAARGWQLEPLIAESLRTHATVEAAEQSLEAAKLQLEEAQRAWWPNFSVEGLVAPSLEIHCSPQAVVDPMNNAVPNLFVSSRACLEGNGGNVTNPIQAHPTGVLTRWEIKMGMPIYTFGKMWAANAAAEQLVKIGQERIVIVKAELAQNVARAFYGLQVAREIIDMVNDGLGKLEKAIKQVEEDLEKTKGHHNEMDRLRLRVSEANVRARSLEAKKGEHLALAGLRILAPNVSGPTFDIDRRPIQPVVLTVRPLAYYVDLAHVHRPESKFLAEGLRLSKINVELNKANFYPDVLLVGSYWRLWNSEGYQDPSSPYMLHFFAPFGYGGGLVVRWSADLHLKIPRYERALADHAAALAGERAATDGVGMDVTNAYENLVEAHERISQLEKAERAAHSWLTAVAQNFAIGTAEAREFNDALFAYFDNHGRYVQAIYDFNTAVAWLSRAVGIDVAK